MCGINWSMPLPPLSEVVVLRKRKRVVPLRALTNVESAPCPMIHLTQSQAVSKRRKITHIHKG